MTVQTAKQFYTFEEYIELEKTAESRNEYLDGEIIPMTGETTNHNEIAGNFYAYLKTALRQKNYKVFFNGVNLWIPRYRHGTYPDVMVIEGKPIYEGTGQRVVTNPSIIVEVLSKSTKNYDQGDKFLHYRSIPQFKEYILIEQTRYYVIQYTKTNDGKWLLTEYEGEENILSLESVDFEISFKDLYEGVEFDEEEA
ncbi:protein of unknown function DUF820 [Gloeothece citriformis PCC 7424]|uniref:Putative restriction endonuclease domain-containing protein n=1 Tax=Gloeothece citriformis (strain PCC 7424) TaxID=65393 RepID=B7K705_GLOC7|nr:Uma2 family endonuclease [Gloeothece citriformis]ACK72704.1 protein of unknown function DUF820 [Gloeothece citriformis PCC 7424]